MKKVSAKTIGIIIVGSLVLGIHPLPTLLFKNLSAFTHMEMEEVNLPTVLVQNTGFVSFAAVLTIGSFTEFYTSQAYCRTPTLAYEYDDIGHRRHI
jgi:hypothetical protein